MKNEIKREMYNTKIEKTENMPKTGQFVAVWMFDDKIWSSTLRWTGSRLERYNEEDGNFYVADAGDFQHNRLDDLHFLVTKEQEMISIPKEEYEVLIRLNTHYQERLNEIEKQERVRYGDLKKYVEIR